MKIARIRELLRMSRRDVARLCGVSQQAVGMWERLDLAKKRLRMLETKAVAREKAISEGDDDER